MSRPEPQTSKQFGARAQAEGFGWRDDDFSIQITHDAHPMFWLRIDRDTTHLVRITDLMSAGLPSALVGLALAAAVEQLGHPNRGALMVDDPEAVALSGPFSGSMPATVRDGRHSDLRSDLRAAIAAYAKLHHMFILSWEPDCTGPKSGWRVRIGT